MDEISKSPAKLACLACRTTKTRCDGKFPCSKCMLKNRDCSYRPSRRGGPRRGPKYLNQVRDARGIDPKTRPLDSLGLLQNSSVAEGEVQSPIQTNPSLPSNLQSLLGGARNANGALGESRRSNLTESSSSIEKSNNREALTVGDQLPALRVYKSENDILNAYYIYIHPYVSLLPPPTGPQYDDQPGVIQPPHKDTSIIERSAFPHWPATSLSLAISAILALIPLPEDLEPLNDASLALRRSHAQMYADAALKEADNDLEELSPGDAALRLGSTQGNFHPNVPFHLHPVLALTILSIYESCQQGNLSRMRNRANLATTAAMDISLHNLGCIASEAQRRAWWSAPPVITMSDSRITTAFPTFNVSFEPWALLLKAEDIIIAVNNLVRDCHIEDEHAMLSDDLKERIRRLDSDLLDLIAVSDRSARQSGRSTRQSGRSTRQSGCSIAAETVASQNMWMITHLIVHSARIRLHRFRAFLDIPIFLDRHCGLSGISDQNFLPLSPQLSGPRNFDSTFPFTTQQSSLICLKSSLVVARAFRNLQSPNPCYTDEPRKPGPCQATSQVYPRSLPLFACAAMQSSYVLFMLHHRIYAALTSERLSACRYLLSQPEDSTEHQDAERLIDEMRSGVESMLFSLKSDLVFEGVGRMSREVEAAYQSTFLL